MCADGLLKLKQKKHLSSQITKFNPKTNMTKDQVLYMVEVIAEKIQSILEFEIDELYQYGNTIVLAKW